MDGREDLCPVLLSVIHRSVLPSTTTGNILQFFLALLRVDSSDFQCIFTRDFNLILFPCIDAIEFTSFSKLHQNC
jgi:hypothetical protein